MVERSLSMREVGGSIPPFSTDLRFCFHHGVIVTKHCIYGATQIGCHPSLAEAQHCTMYLTVLSIPLSWTNFESP